MTLAQLEGRVRALEIEVARLREMVELRERACKPWWEAYGAASRAIQGSMKQRGSGVSIVSRSVRDPDRGPAAPVIDHPHIEYRPGVCGGSAVIEGTRIPVRLIVGFVRDGLSTVEILSSYTDLSSEQVQAALDYYAEHREEIDRELEECHLSFVEKKFGLMLDSRGFLVPRT